MRISLLLVALLATACQKGAQKDPPAAKPDAAAGRVIKPLPRPDAGAKPVRTGKDLDSKDILARSPRAPIVDVKHVLIGWKDIKIGRRKQDPRAAARDNDAAARLALDIAEKLKADPTKIDALVQEHSEDQGSLRGLPYTVDATAGYVQEFKDLALRLELNEVGIVRTDFGYHVMIRVPEDPLESRDILARPPNKGIVHVKHILIAWKDAPAAKHGRVGPKGMARTKDDADKLTKELFDKVVAGGDFVALMKEHSEDEGSAQSGDSYEAHERAQLVEPFKNLAMRLRMDEAGIVKTEFGWHIIKRVPPPPPDPIESADILARDEVTQKAKVKHILLGWTEASTGKPPGSTRTRAELEALVKKTMGRLAKGEKIEDLMKELSEDGGSAQSGNSYDVTPTASLVEPFKALSLRLNVGEFGAVRTQFGIHIIQRTE